jgi:hypothetical protein
MSINAKVIVTHLKLFKYRGMKYDGLRSDRTGRADWADGNDASSGSALGTLLILDCEGFDSEDEDIYSSSISEKTHL